MNGMNTAERLAEISELSGLSVDIIRRVIEAERLSIVNSLKRGERATLIGRCVIRPEIRNKIGISDSSGNIPLNSSIKLYADVAPSLSSELAELSGFETNGISNYEEEGVWLNQIPALE